MKTAAEPLDTGALDGYLTDELGWLDLNNAVATLDVAGTRVDAFGVSDAHRDWDRLDLLEDPLAELQADGRGVVTLGVTHAPYRRVLDTFTDLGADVIFGGHTHGGQVRIPGYGALVANCDIPLDQARGLSDVESSRAHDSAERQRGPRTLHLRTGPLRLPAGGVADHPGREVVTGFGAHPTIG